MITLNNESFAWDPLKIWLQAWTSHSGSCSPRCHHMIWGALKKLLLGWMHICDTFSRSRKKPKTDSNQSLKRSQMIGDLRLKISMYILPNFPKNHTSTNSKILNFVVCINYIIQTSKPREFKCHNQGSAFERPDFLSSRSRKLWARFRKLGGHKILWCLRSDLYFLFKYWF